MRTQEQIDHTAELVAALKSGDYKQGRQRLKTADGKFCCLGVACVIAGTLFEHVSKNGSPGYGAVSKVGSVAMYDYYAMPPSVADYYGFRSVSGSFTWDERTTKIIMDWAEEASKSNLVTPSLRFMMSHVEENKTTVFKNPDDREMSLAELNDNQKLPFSVIADIIEAAPPGLFI